MTGLMKFLRNPLDQPSTGWIDKPIFPTDSVVPPIAGVGQANPYGDTLYRLGGPTGIMPVPNQPSLGRALLCDGMATFSAVGGKQAPGFSAFAKHMKPANGTVAIAGPQTFGFGKRALRQGAASAIKIYSTGLDDVLRKTSGPRPPYSVSDFGDKHIRGAPGLRFDLYRFPTIKLARQFGMKSVPVMIEVPPGGHCPPDTYPRRR